LNAESAFYWSWACAKFKSLENNKKNKFFELDNCANDDDCDYLDKLVPSLTEYSGYVQQYSFYLIFFHCVLFNIFIFEKFILTKAFLKRWMKKA
jgi:hypothetical protein